MYSPMETYKIILIGDVSVGKTNLLTQYVDGKFTEKTNNTIGIEFKNKIIEIKNGRKLDYKYGIHVAKKNLCQ